MSQLQVKLRCREHDVDLIPEGGLPHLDAVKGLSYVEEDGTWVIDLSFFTCPTYDSIAGHEIANPPELCEHSWEILLVPPHSHLS